MDWTPPKGAHIVSSTGNGWQPPSGAEVVEETPQGGLDKVEVIEPPFAQAPTAGSASPSTLAGGSGASASSAPGPTEWQPDPIPGVQLPESVLSNDVGGAQAPVVLTEAPVSDVYKHTVGARQQREKDAVDAYLISRGKNDLFSPAKPPQQFSGDPNAPPAPVKRMLDDSRAKPFADYEAYMLQTDPGYAERMLEREQRSAAGTWTPDMQLSYEYDVLDHQRKVLEGQRLMLERAARRGIPLESMSGAAQAHDAGIELLKERYTELAARDTKTFQDKVNEEAQRRTDIIAEALPVMAQGDAIGDMFIKGGADVMGNAMVGVTRLLDFGEGYTTSDRFADYIIGVREANETAIASKYKESGFTVENFLPKLAQGAGSMAALVGSGIATGGAGPAVMGGVTFASEYESYVQQAIAGGATEAAAENAGYGYAVLSTAIETLNPQTRLMGPAAKQAIKNVFLKGAKDGLTDKQMIAKALKEIGGSGGKEAAEETLQLISEKATNYAVNELSGANLDTEVRAAEVAEGAVVGFVLGGLARLGAMPSESAAARRTVSLNTDRGPQTFSTAQAEAIAWAAGNVNAAKDAINKTAIPKTEKEQAAARLDELSAIYKGNRLHGVDPKTAVDVARNMLHKNELLKDQNENPTDPIIAEAGGDPRQAEIEAIDKANLKALKLKLPNEEVAAKNERPSRKPSDNGRKQVVEAQREATAPVSATAPEDAQAAPGVPVPAEPVVTKRQSAADRKADRDTVIKEAASAGPDAMGIRGQVLQYFIGDNDKRKGRVNTGSLISELGLRNPATGKTGEGLRRLISLHGKDAPTIEKLAEDIALNQDGAQPHDVQEVRDEIIDILGTYTGRAEMIEGLRERLPSTMEAKSMEQYMRSAEVDDAISALAEEGIPEADILAHREEDEEALGSLTEEQLHAYYQQYIEDPDVAPEGVGDTPVPQGAAPDEEGDRLAAEAATARRERDKVVANWNERGQALFAPEEGASQQSIDGGFDNSKENFDAIIEPMNEKVRHADAALSEHVGKAADRAATARAQASIDDEDVAASSGKRAPGRIPVSPIAGEVRKRTQVLKDLGKGVGRTIQFGKPASKRRGVLGTYAPGSSQVKIRYAGDLDTTAHEIGHSLDDVFGLTTDLMKSLAGLMEVRQLAPFGSTPPKGAKDPRKYEAQEGVAEYVRAVVMNPDQARIAFPAITEAYDRLLSEEAKAAISKFSEDVRAFAGASGADMVMSNIQTDPTKSRSEVLKKMFSKEEGFSVSFADRMKANWINPLTAFRKAQRYAQEIGNAPEPLNPAKNPYLLARLLLHNGGKISEVLESGMITAQYRPVLDQNGVPKNIDWLLAPFDASSEESVRKDMNDTIALMVAERTIELAGKLGRSDILTGIGGGLFADVDVAQKAIWELTADPARAARLQDGARRYREMATHVLEYLRDKGRISRDQFDLLNTNNVQYVALQRVMETAPDEPVVVFTGDGSALASVKAPVKSIKGSSRTIKDPYGSLLDGINKSIREADRNEVMLAFTDLLRSDRSMHDGDPVNFSEVGSLAKAGDKNTVTVFRDGKAEYWRFQEDIYKALKGLDDEGYMLPGIVRAPAAVLRWTVTHFPVFAARNIARDLQVRMIMSNSYGLLDTVAMKQLRDLVGNKEHWRDVAVAGGLNSGYYLKDDVHYYGLMNEAVDRMREDKRFILVDPGRWGVVWKAYEDTLYKTETLNRVAEYRAAFRDAKEQGMDDYNAQLHAAFMASDLIDFALAGHHARVMNQVVPFTNAMIQGLRSAVVSARQDPAGFTTRIALYSILPAVITWMLAHGDGEDEEYEALPAYQRDMFYNIKIGPDTWVSIPKPFELGLPGAFVDRAMSAANGKDNAFDGYAGSVMHSFLPDEAAIAGPGRLGVELLANYDFFRNKPIVPPHEDKLNLAYRNTEASSRVGQVMQDATGIDARKFDHAIKSQFSYFGNTALKLADIGKEDSRNRFGLADLGFFRGSPAYNSAVVTDLTVLASEHGLTGTREYRDFRKVVDEYFSAEGPKKRDAAAQVLRTEAERLLPFFEKLAEAKIEETVKEKSKAQ